MNQTEKYRKLVREILSITTENHVSALDALSAISSVMIGLCVKYNVEMDEFLAAIRQVYMERTDEISG